MQESNPPNMTDLTEQPNLYELTIPMPDDFDSENVTRIIIEFNTPNGPRAYILQLC